MIECLWDTSQFRKKTDMLHRSSFDLENFNEMGITRVHSVVVKKSKNNFVFTNPIQSKPNSRFEILEQWTKGESRLRLLVIFNETTTLKIKLLKECVGGKHEDKKNTQEHLETQEADIASTSNPEEKEGRIHTGKYTIEQMKPLMFAKDPIKNSLFEHIIHYVQKHFWFDTLHRFLEIVDLIYSDLVHYYGKAIKEFSSNQQSSRIEVRDNKDCLIVDGSIKSAKLTCCTPIFGKNSFLVYPLASDSYAHMPITGNRKLPSKGPMSELNSSLADTLTAFRSFVSTFA